MGRCKRVLHFMGREDLAQQNEIRMQAVKWLVAKLQGDKTASSKVPEGHHPRGTTLREALRGNLPLRGLCRGLSEGSAGVSPRVLRGLCGALRGSAGFSEGFGGSDPMLVTLGNCWSFFLQESEWSREVPR